MSDFWKKSVLEHVPHGEDGTLSLCTDEEMSTLVKLLINKGYAVCITGGDIGDTYTVHWVYAGESGSLDFADYDRVVFTLTDYIEDYPEAYLGTLEEEDVPEYDCEVDD